MKLSICMMVKNEEKNMTRCLESIKNIMEQVDSELIILDTGSSDNTVEISRKYTDKVFFKEWNNNFSDMRNESIKNAKGEWIFILDADEEITDDRDIIYFFSSDECKKYNTASVICKSITEKDIYSFMVSLRLFRNDGSFKYMGAVHNQPIYKLPILNLKSEMLHYGYVAYDKELMEKKFIRTSTILKQELKKNPEDVYYRFQLSVSYRMYKDYIQALTECEKAYSCFLKQKLNPKEYLYLFYELAINYVNNNRYEQAEKICEEGIRIEKEYIDLYFYLGSAKMMLGKYEEGISAYEKYLELNKNYDKLSIRNNTGMMNYTLGLKDEVYYNIAVINYRNKKYSKVIELLNLIKSNNYIETSTNMFIDACFALGNYEALKVYYEKNIIKNKNIKYAFLVSLEKNKNKLKDEDKKRYIDIFSKGDDEYFRLNSIRFSYLSNDENLFTYIGNFISLINMNDRMDYYGDLIYYLIGIKKPLADILFNVTENNLNKYFYYISEIYDDYLEVALDYINIMPSNSFKEKRINKVICKWIVTSNKLNDNDYNKIFHRYIDDGTDYMLALYKDDILKNEYIYELKNNDEVFFLYILLAEKIKESDKKRYIDYLRKALNICPYMNKGIEILLDDFKKSNSKENSEFEIYKVKIKQKIEQLLESNKVDQALNIISEYEKLVKDDIEIYSIKGCILIEKCKFNEAEEILKKGLSIDECNFDLNYNLGYLYENTNENELSLESYKRAIKATKDGNTVNDLNSIIERVLIKLNLFIEEKYFKNNKISEYIETERYNELINYLMELLRQRKFEFVLNACNYLIKNLRDSIPSLYLLKGIACNGLKDYELAEKYHKIAIRLDKHLCDILGDEKKSDIIYKEDIISCIGCGHDEFSIVNVSNQSLSESNKGLINPIRRWVKCRKCGLIYSNPIPEEETMNKYYSSIAKEKFSGIYGDIKDREVFLFSMANDRLNKISSYIKEGKILDIGTGIGTFVKAAIDRGIEAYGLELTPEDCEYAKVNYGIELIQRNFYDFGDENQYDVVTMFEVIEHLRHPQEDLIRINHIIKKNGLFVIATPILDSNYGDETKENNVFWNVVSHLSYFTKNVLSDYLKNAGFMVIDIKDSIEGMGRMEFYCRKISNI